MGSTAQARPRHGVTAAAQIGSFRRLAAALLLCLVFGSIHAFSVLLEPLETWLGAGRSAVSLVYSVAIAAITLGVFLSATLQQRLHPRGIAMSCGVLAAASLSLAASGKTLFVFLVGYGLAGGLANGLAHSLSLAQAARAAPRNPGWAMGLATAVYGLGSVIFAQILALLLAHMPVQIVVAVLAAILGAASLAAAALLPSATTPGIDGPDAPEASAATLPPQRVAMLWLIYLLGASGGLMVIAHSAEIMAERDVGASTMALAPTLVGLGSIAGGYVGGTMGTRLPPRLGLSLPLLTMAASLAVFTLTRSQHTGHAVMLICGLCYGALIAIIPSIIRRQAGAEGFARAFGTVFTAWGLAGVLGPLAAGMIFDANGHYLHAMILAMGLLLAGAAASLLLGDHEDQAAKT